MIVSFTIGMAIFAISFSTFLVKRYLEKRKYGDDYSQKAYPVYPNALRATKISSIAFLAFLVIGLFENGDCLNALLSGRPNAESYCQPKESTNLGF